MTKDGRSRKRWFRRLTILAGLAIGAWSYRNKRFADFDRQEAERLRRERDQT